VAAARELRSCRPAHSCPARSLGRCSRRSVGPRAVSALVAATGIDLIGSGVFVTDPVGGFPPVTAGEGGSGDSAPAETVLTREGTLHNLCAISIFAGIPAAGLASALAAARRRDYRWTCYSAGSSFVMVGSFLPFGASSGRVPRLAGKGGGFQRMSIASGFGWLNTLSPRALSSQRHPQTSFCQR
jgi:hypothetical protein